MENLLVIPIIAVIFLFHRSVWRLDGTPNGLLAGKIATVGGLALLAGAFAAALMGAETMCCTLFFVAIFFCWPCTLLQGKEGDTTLAATTG